MNLLETINNDIAKRTKYGIREQIAYGRGYVLSWSNANKCWNIIYRVKMNDVVNLDANQILVESKRKDIDEVLGQLDQLPLYKNSFEARLGK